MKFDDPIILFSPTGAQLSLRTHYAQIAPRGVIHINHGLAEHTARYAPFAGFLARQGFHVYAHDHRGHGLTRASDAPIGRFATRKGTRKLIEDVEAVHELIAQKHPGLPIVLFGHSMGGLIALNHLLNHPSRIHALAIWNANFQSGPALFAARAILLWERFRLGSDVPSHFLPKLTFQAWAKSFSHHRSPFDWLSRDTAQVDAYISDPLCGWNGSVSLWFDLLSLSQTGAQNKNFSHIRKDLPIHLLGGAQDPATNGGKAVRQLGKRFCMMGFEDVTCIIHGKNRHESLHEINRTQIMDDFGLWLDRICAAPKKPNHPV
ncbi:alpha/beta fold hydrolase [Aquamicrobium segne]|uniref:Alpha/beta fold hydrolase n=1 Tax=Aquamicrobium segne TaxID=469547 RepID=A0ABW0H4F9_9HYPH